MKATLLHHSTAIMIVFAAGAALASGAGSPKKPAPAASGDGRIVVTAVTEMTDAGKKLRTASAAEPVYFVTHSLGYKARGDAVKEPVLTQEEIEPALISAAATNGYVPSSAAHAPEIALVYMWGSHFGIDQDVVPASDDQLIRNMLDRASLAGGRKFAADLAKAYRDSDTIAMAGPGVVNDLPEQFQGAQIGAARGMLQMNATMDPLRLFMLKSPKHQQLTDHAARNIYFVVVSAYDYASLATKQSRLLWRTTVTAGAQRTSQKQAIPAALAFGAPYFGREMAEAEISKTQSR